MSKQATSAPRNRRNTSAPATEKPVAPSQSQEAAPAPTPKPVQSELDKLVNSARCEAGRHKAALEIVGGGKVKGDALASRIRAGGVVQSLTERDAKRLNAALGILAAVERIKRLASDLRA
jgi:hypothetical protein